MKTKYLILIMIVGLATGDLRAADPLTEAFQKALFEEEANHNLDAAIRAYQSVIEQHDAQRKLAATAVFRLGECYRKLGQTNAAVVQYQRLLRDFADQTNLVTLSRQNLIGLGSPAETAPASPLAKAARLEQKRLLEQEIKLVEQELATLKKQAEVGLVSQEAHIPKERELLALRRQLAGLEARPWESSAATVAAGATAEEEQEIRRVQAMIKNSPDLINAPGSDKLTPLQSAAGKGQLAVARFLLDNKADVNLRTEKSWRTPLDEAAANGHKGVAELLLARGAEVNANDGSALRAAAEKGFRSVVEALLAAKADPNARDYRGDTPLHLAAQNRFAAVVELLIKHGANVNVVNRRGKPGDDPNRVGIRHVDGTPLHLALAAGDDATASLLLSNRADVTLGNFLGETPLHVGVARPAVMRQMIAAGADVNSAVAEGPFKTWRPLHYAIAWNWRETVELLLKSGADPNAFAATVLEPPNLSGRVGYTPLLMAIAKGRPELVSLLLQYKADVNKERPLGLAVEKDDLSTARVLLEAGADPNARVPESPRLPQAAASSRGGIQVALPPPVSFGGAPIGAPVGPSSIPESWAPLHFAVSNNRRELVELLLQYKADPNATIPSVGDDACKNYTPLLMAANSGFDDMAGLLLKFKADPNLAKDCAKSPLLRAAYDGRLGLVEVLLQHGADTEARSSDGDTALSFAARHGLRELAELLLAHKANVNATNNAAWTPLHQAVASGQRALVDLLLAHKAEINARNNEGKTPLDLATGSVYYEKRGLIPTSLLPPFVARSASTAPARSEMVPLLKQHGAKGDLPVLDRIEVRRPSAGYARVVFHRDANDYNRFTLLELIAVHYEFLTTSSGKPQRERRYLGANNTFNDPLSFPDFERVVIRRPTPDGTGRKEISVDLAAVFKSENCAGDRWLEWGDVVEVPEIDRVFRDPWYGLPPEVLVTLKKCLTRRVHLTVAGQTIEVTIGPEITVQEGGIPWVTQAQLTLAPVLGKSGLLRDSCDLSRVRVKRRDPATGQTREIVLDCSNPSLPSDLWLREGDVIEVPGK